MNNPFFKIPDIFTAKRVLCVQPHPDDMDISIGGTLKRLTENGTEIHYLTVTDDSAGFAKAAPGARERMAIRKEEQEAAGAILGISSFRWLDLPDAGDWSHYEARLGIIEAIRELQPDFMLTVDPSLSYESHMDHLKTGRAASEAAILYNFPHVGGVFPSGFSPYELSAVGFVWSNNPNTVIETTAWSNVKFEAISMHKSQFPSAEDIEQIKTYLTWRASMDAADYNFELGETLKLLPPIMLHCFPEAKKF